MNVKKKGAAFFGTAVAAMALSAMAAFACTNLATLNLSTASGGVGDTVTVTGSSFRVPRASDASQTVMPVVLNWNGADGPVLAETTPDAAGNISATFSVPEGQPGYYVLVASQKDAEGVDAYGTPARASFQILGPNGQSVVQNPGSQAAPVTADPSSSGIIALTVGLGALGLALFGAGFTAFVRQAKSREVPVASKVRND
ncbi:MAG: hypothetical protein M3507_09945 [Actinomycetota bacterium]|jgi:hypothetical protein|nr:hypothetical protein [Actinomycetota bacterium]